MNTNTNEQTETSKLITLKQYCETNGLDVARARRIARTGDFTGAVKMLGVWAIASDAPVPDMPMGTRGTSRTDGRKRYIVYANDTEIANIFTMFGVGNESLVINPREQRRERIANANVTDTDE